LLTLAITILAIQPFKSAKPWLASGPENEDAPAGGQ
jgi:hypothetical protein